MSVAMTSRRCWYCSSDRLSDIAWRDLMPRMPMLDTTLIFDGAKPIPTTLTFCESCGEWLASSPERKQVEELIAAIRLVSAAAMPWLSGSRLEHADKPDIRVHLDGQIYGLEVTRIVRGGEDAISRAQWRRVVERTGRLLWRKRHNPPAWVRVTWLPDPPRTNVQTVARPLVDLVEQHFATLPQIHTWTDVDPKQIPNDLASFVSSLHILRTQKDDAWVSGFAGSPDVQPQELQGEIDKKALKVDGYSPPSDGLWLLIYAEASNAAQALDLTDEAQSASYSGPFDRVFFLDCMNNAAELRMR
jgi:hypothetical protein